VRSYHICLLVAIIAVLAPREVAATDPVEVQKTLKHVWEATHTLELVQRCYKNETLIEEINYVVDDGGRRAMRQVGVRGAIRIPAVDFLENGKVKYNIDRTDEDKHPPVVTIDSQEDKHNIYKGPLFSGLWIITPRGTPLWKILDKPISWEEKVDGRGKFVLAMLNVPANGPMWFELDPAHDWLPRRLATTDQRFVIEVDTFQKKNGFWFPKMGREKLPIPPENKIEERKFEITADVNEVLPTNRFNLPEMPKGTIIKDNITNSGRVVGYDNIESFLRIQTNSGNMNATVSKMQVPDKPKHSLWPYVVGGLAVAALTASIFLRMRR